ncbi:minor capsid protein [Enterococcus hulanensis]|uniref:putative minor capsid protein n=1 Tax=Enterococcus hulanensis TaxID=2559929 RepID=UPI001A900925|nr:putative minor capsid protein [Enterococcus hulanensis]MBO0456187.1 minor capsid protein [Enterococcus hulanensis]
MVMPKPPKEFLVDSFIYREYLGEGDWNKPKYGEEKTISFCRIDRGSQYSFGPSGKQLLYHAVVFCYAGLTDPMPDFKEQSLLIFDGREHKLVKVEPIYEAYTNEIYSYEIEVI